MSCIVPHINTISISTHSTVVNTHYYVHNVGFLYDLLLAAQTFFEVIKRFKKVLKAYNQGLKLSAACAYAGVNELTVRSTASIAELATASLAEFTKLLDKTKQAKLKDVANLLTTLKVMLRFRQK